MAYFTTADGTPIHYTDTGAGRPIVLLQALMFNADYYWQHNLPVLAERQRVIAVDHRGHGLSGKPNHGYTIERLARDLHELFEYLDLQDVVLVGFSLGGFVSLRYLKDYGGKRIGRLVLMEMTPRLPSAPGWEHPTFGEFPLEAAQGYSVALKADRNIYRDFFGAAFLEPPTGARLEEMLAQTYLTPTDAAAALMDDMAAQDWRDEMAGLELPVTLFYCSPNNKILPTPLGLWLNGQIEGSELTLFENSSHCPFWEEADTFNRALIDAAAR